MAKNYSVSLSEELVADIDKYCERASLTRSGFLAVACREYLNAKAVEPELKRQVDALTEAFKELSAKLDSNA